MCAYIAACVSITDTHRQTHTCRVVEGKAVIQHIVWGHLETVVNQRSHAIVPERQNDREGRRREGEREEVGAVPLFTPQLGTRSCGLGAVD